MHIYLFIIFYLCYSYLNGNEKPEGKRAKKVIVYVQATNGKLHKNEEQNFDTLGKLIETIRYDQHGQVWQIEKNYYDALGQRILLSLFF